jgi:hypothetical protein
MNNEFKVIYSSELLNDVDTNNSFIYGVEQEVLVDEVSDRPAQASILNNSQSSVAISTNNNTSQKKGSFIRKYIETATNLTRSWSSSSMNVITNNGSIKNHVNGQSKLQTTTNLTTPSSINLKRKVSIASTSNDRTDNIKLTSLSTSSISNNFSNNNNDILTITMMKVKLAKKASN